MEQENKIATKSAPTENQGEQGNSIEIEINNGAKDIEFLKNINLDKIEELLVVFHKHLSLKFINKFSNLKNLVVAGSIKNYSPISNCLSLESLCISSGKMDDLDFIKPLKIKELSLEVIRSKNVDELIIPNLETLENLTISSVSKITDLSFLEEFGQLKRLFLFEFKAKKLFDFSKMNNLEKLSIVNMFHLKNYNELKTIKELDELYIKYFYINRKMRKNIIQEIAKTIKETNNINKITVDDNGKIYDKEILLKME